MVVLVKQGLKSLLLILYRTISGIYIVHFKNNTREAEQQHFVAVLNKKLNTTVDYVAEIIEKFLPSNA